MLHVRVSQLANGILEPHGHESLLDLVPRRVSHLVWIIVVLLSFGFSDPLLSLLVLVVAAEASVVSRRR